jgi:hypothetical protein
MGWGNVRNSLALAQTQLASYGITQPTAQQLAPRNHPGQEILLVGWRQIRTLP